MGMEDAARCVGLWLAEGDNKTNAEITFTNNCFGLVDFFQSTLRLIFPSIAMLNPRIYVYSATGERPVVGGNVVVKYYLDERANTPYYIWRVASKTLLGEWHVLVNEIKQHTELYPFILQGFFAGEGNIRYHKPSQSRMVRIAQGRPNKFIERMLRHLGISYTYATSERAYVITGFQNIKKLSEIKIASLHPKKRGKFDEICKFKEIHYPHLFLKGRVYQLLENPYTTEQLSKNCGRSFARLQDVLIELKKEGKITNFRVRSKDYWIRGSQNLIIVSSVKGRILDATDTPRTTAFVANKLGVTWQNAFKRLTEMERLGLIRRGETGWEKVNIAKNVLVI